MTGERFCGKKRFKDFVDVISNYYEKPEPLKTINPGGIK